MKAYAKLSDIDYEVFFISGQYTGAEVTCKSATHDGFFYTDKNGELCEGYPC